MISTSPRETSDSSWTQISQRVEKAIESISHRGPDSRKFYFDSQVCFGICRLAIVDIEGGSQPVFNETRTIVSIFNGEIYNYKELRKLLVSRGYKLRSQGDAECIPNLYAEFGWEFVKLLDGMFAIAIYDRTNQQSLLVRDRVGEKPLWYSIRSGKLIFGSEQKALLHMRQGKELNVDALVEYLQVGYINSPKSIYTGIKQVPPGQVVLIKNNVISELSYWNPQVEINRQINYQSAKAQTLDILSNSIKKCSVSERPLGVFLSGGIDSTLISAISSQISNSKNLAFTIGFGEKRYDELTFAKEIAKELGVDHKFAIVQDGILEILTSVTKILDQPFADSSIIPTYCLSKLASKDVVVALGGDGGDEVFAGYKRYHLALTLQRIDFLASLLPKTRLVAFMNKNRSLRRLIFAGTQRELKGKYFSLQRVLQKSELQSVFPGILDQLTLEVESNRIWSEMASGSNLSKMQLFDLKTYLPGDLMYKSDIASMAFGLEVRSPFLNHKLIEFGLSLPAEFKLYSGNSKRILKDILSEYLPEKLFDRPKQGFAAPKAKWLRAELKDFYFSELLGSSSPLSEYFNVTELKSIYDCHINGEDHSELLWSFLMLGMWQKNWISSTTH